MSAKSKAIQARIRRQANRPRKGTVRKVSNSAKMTSKTVFGFDIINTEGMSPDTIRVIGETTVDVIIGACPKCGATGDDPCRKPNGRIADQPHRGRETPNA